MLKILNTLTRKKEEFTPLDKNKVSFYHCGPTVYWTQHIGNMRAMVLADVIRRTFEYLGYEVNMVRNYTDVGHLTGDNEGDPDQGEDKMEKAAKREKLDPQAIANKYIKEFDRDLNLLNIETPEYRPKATEVIPEAISMVEEIIKNGYAYITDLGIYFEVEKFKDYGKLTGQSLEEKQAGSGKAEVHDSEKHNPADFFIWLFKAGTHKNALQTWPSPFTSPLVENGQGFPGWHLECSVMAKKYLGDTIDVHMGGIEHIPIHHTNEIAQSEAANGTTFVNYWLHNEHLLVDNGKMSKSAGTSYTLQNVTDKGYDPLALRYFFLNAHYRSKQNFTWEALEAAQTTLEKLRDRFAELDEAGEGAKDYENKFQAAIADDFNTPQALAIMWELLKSNESNANKKASLLKFDTVFGLKLAEFKKAEITIPDDIQELIAAREQARADKDFAKADQLRNEIEAQGFELEDTQTGPKVSKKQSY